MSFYPRMKVFLAVLFWAYTCSGGIIRGSLDETEVVVLDDGLSTLDPFDLEARSSSWVGSGQEGGSEENVGGYASKPYHRGHGNWTGKRVARAIKGGLGELQVSTNCRTVVAINVADPVSCSRIKQGDILKFDAFYSPAWGSVVTGPGGEKKDEYGQANPGDYEGSDPNWLDAHGKVIVSNLPGRCRYDAMRAKQDPTTACLCVATQATCTANRDGCFWHADAKTGYQECISKAEKFYNQLTELLQRRGKKSFAINIKYGATGARGQLPLGPYGPAIIGGGSSSVTTTPDIHGNNYGTKHHYGAKPDKYGAKPHEYGPKAPHDYYSSYVKKDYSSFNSMEHNMPKSNHYSHYQPNMPQNSPLYGMDINAPHQKDKYGLYQPNMPKPFYQSTQPHMDYQPNNPHMDYQPNNPHMDYQPNKPHMDYQLNKPHMDYQPNQQHMDYQLYQPMIHGAPQEQQLRQHMQQPEQYLYQSRQPMQQPEQYLYQSVQHMKQPEQQMYQPAQHMNQLVQYMNHPVQYKSQPEPDRYQSVLQPAQHINSPAQQTYMYQPAQHQPALEHINQVVLPVEQSVQQYLMQPAIQTGFDADSSMHTRKKRNAERKRKMNRRRGAGRRRKNGRRGGKGRRRQKNNRSFVKRQDSAPERRSEPATTRAPTPSPTRAHTRSPTAAPAKRRPLPATPFKSLNRSQGASSSRQQKSRLV